MSAVHQSHMATLRVSVNHVGVPSAAGEATPASQGSMLKSSFLPSTSLRRPTSLTLALRNHQLSLSRLNRHPLGRRVCLPISATLAGQEEVEVETRTERILNGSIFGEERALTAPQAIAKSLPGPARLATCAAIIAGAAAAGYVAGGKVASPPLSQVAGAVALGAAGAGAAYVIQSSAKDAAAAELHNVMVARDDPLSITSGEVKDIGDRFGASLEDGPLLTEMQQLYERFVWAVLPPGNEPLRGDEVDLIVSFKESLGLEDELAAPVHMEVGRRLFRQRLETGDKSAAIEERKTFQKLVYVSNLVFGEKSRFLLPWKRIFKVTDSQIEVAVRNNAQALFEDRLRETKADSDVEGLKKLRREQLAFKLSDELAADMFRAEARARVESFIGNALDVLKARTRIKDVRKVVAELDAMRAYNQSLAAAAKAAPADQLVPGIGPVTVFGGQYGEDRGMDDLKSLYRTYLEQALTSKTLEPHQVEALAELRNIFGMGKREAEDVTEDVTKKVYRRRLADAVTSGALDSAPSKAEFLQALCDDLQFNPELAGQIHEEIYRQKLQQCLEDGSLSDDDVTALQRLRVLLCVPKAVVDKAHADICGGIFTKVIDDAISAGVDGYDGDMRKAVQGAVKGLRITTQAAIEIASKAVRAVFLTFIKRARSSMSRTEAARELKKMVIFSNLTVSQLIDDIKGEAPPEEKEEEEKKKKAEEAAAADLADDDELDFDDKIPMIQSMRKTRGKAKEGKAQKEISVKDDLEVRERLDLYKTFLIFCLQGDTAGMPMGTAITVQRDTSDFVRLSQLGDILGLTPMEAASVHQGLAEQAFKNQAETLLADGQLSKTRAEQLKEIQKQLGLPDAVAQKVVQSITSSKMAGAIDQAVQQGRLSLDDIRGLRESGVSIDTMVAKKVREQMFSKLVEKELAKGTGVFDAAEILGKLPTDLGLEQKQAESTVKEMARERRKGSLVQAVSLLRQKKPKEVVSMLLNMLACDSVEPSPEPVEWPVKEELLDLYCLFLNDKEAVFKSAAAAAIAAANTAAAASSENGTNGTAAPPAAPPAPPKERLRELLGIEDGTAASLEEMVASGGFSLEGVQEEKFVF